MNKLSIKPFNVIDKALLPEIVVDQVPSDGDPIEISGEMYYVCENISVKNSDPNVIGVIPLVVRNPSNIVNINNYIECLPIAHRKVLFKNSRGVCDFDNCDEMIIS